MAKTEQAPAPGPTLEDGMRVGVVGGGPAGSFFAYFLLVFAERVGLDLQVDIYEYRDFANPAPVGCNMCGGIISESLVQMLAAEGIELPANVIQRGIDSYVLHMDVGSVRIDTPLHEMRIGAVHRGAGPRGVKQAKWGSFDGYLLSLAEARGARVVRSRVERVTRPEGKPVLELRGGESREHDLVAVAAGVNAASKLCEAVDGGYPPPVTTKAYIREYFLGDEAVSSVLGSSMHVFLPDIRQIEFAAIVPKGDYATLCMLGEGIDAEVVRRFMDTPWIRSCLPAGVAEVAQCQCGPRLNVGGAPRVFGDRLVFIGDCGVTRLYKDGIGAAYRTAKAAASTAVFEGLSEAAFRRHYLPACRRIEADNRIGALVFKGTGLLQRMRFARRAVLAMTRGEQRLGATRHMSAVLWNTFTGSEPYRTIVRRGLHPGFVSRLVRHLAGALVSTGPASS
jgi:flavin-dependent dehydrogenase